MNEKQRAVVVCGVLDFAMGVVIGMIAILIIQGMFS